MEQDTEPAVVSHRFQAWAEIGQETGQLHGGKRRGGVTRPLRNGRQKQMSGAARTGRPEAQHAQ